MGNVTGTATLIVLAALAWRRFVLGFARLLFLKAVSPDLFFFGQELVVLHKVILICCRQIPFSAHIVISLAPRSFSKSSAVLRKPSVPNPNPNPNLTLTLALALTQLPNPIT
jgi:hypothetical protein